MVVHETLPSSVKIQKGNMIFVSRLKLVGVYNSKWFISHETAAPLMVTHRLTRW